MNAFPNLIVGYRRVAAKRRYGRGLRSIASFCRQYSDGPGRFESADAASAHNSEQADPLLSEPETVKNIPDKLMRQRLRIKKYGGQGSGFVERYRDSEKNRHHQKDEMSEKIENSHRHFQNQEMTPLLSEPETVKNIPDKSMWQRMKKYGRQGSGFVERYRDSKNRHHQKDEMSEKIENSHRHFQSQEMTPLLSEPETVKNIPDKSMWQRMKKYGRQGSGFVERYRDSEKNRHHQKDEMSEKIDNSNRHFQSQEMALITDKAESMPLVKAIRNCPMKLQDWGKVTKVDREHLLNITAVLNETNPYVSRILQSTAPPTSQVVIDKWKKRKIEELGEDGYEAHMTNLINEGRSFHKVIECCLKGKPVVNSESGEWKSISVLLEKISDVKCLETPVSHPFLSYSGRVDCIANYKNTLCILDFKLSSKPKETLKKCYDDPYQVAAYAGAFNMSSDSSVQVSSAVVVKAYRNGAPADVHFMDDFVLELYWEGWLKRLARHHMQIYNSA